jgi:hypothetical protein
MASRHHVGIVLTVKALIVKYLRGGTRVASPTRLDISFISVSQIIKGREVVKERTLTVLPSTTQVYLEHWQSRNPSTP